MIPKIIHYIWLGDTKNQSDTVKMCIDSWYKKLPDYKIILHNEETDDLSNPLIQECLSNKKYAYASDILRLEILINNPGIYLDTDIEVLQSFNDLLENKAFIGCEHSQRVACGVIGVDHTNDEVLLNWYNWYKNKSIEELVYNPEIITKLFKDKGFTSIKKYPKIIDGWRIYPQEYFYPISYYENRHKISTNSRTIHYWSGSAINDENWSKSINKIFNDTAKIISNIREDLISE